MTASLTRRVALWNVPSLPERDVRLFMGTLYATVVAFAFFATWFVLTLFSVEVAPLFMIMFVVTVVASQAVALHLRLRNGKVEYERNVAESERLRAEHLARIQRENRELGEWMQAHFSQLENETHDDRP